MLLLPHPLGERSPLWGHNACGAFIGMGISTGERAMTRAVLEGVGFNLKTILDILENYDTIETVTMIGGGAKGKTWMRILADIWQTELAVPRYLEEAASMGPRSAAGPDSALLLIFRLRSSVIPRYPASSQTPARRNSIKNYIMCLQRLMRS